jgi:ligand-binding sensor domain-containing protein
MSTYRGGVYSYDLSDKKMTYYPVMKGNDQLHIVSLYQDNHGGLWLGMEDDGVYRFNGNAFVKAEF